MNNITNYRPDMPQSNAAVPMENINQGSVAIEASRAVAEAQGKLILAKQYPRDENAAYNKMIMACSRMGLAQKAFYSYPRGGETVSGPTIRLAEVLARCWGNVEYGIKELSQDNGKSEMQAYAWDLETNTMSVQNFTNPHAKEVKGKIRNLTSLRDIYENNANMGGRRLRSRILAIMPADFVEAAVEECRRTLAGQNSEPIQDRVRKMIVAFSKFGVTEAMIEKRLKHKLDAMSPEELTDYIGIFNSMREKQTTVSDWFEYEEKSDIAAAIDSNAIAQTINKPDKNKTTESEPAPEPTAAADAPFNEADFDGLL